MQDCSEWEQLGSGCTAIDVDIGAKAGTKRPKEDEYVGRHVHRNSTTARRVPCGPGAYPVDSKWRRDPGGDVRDSSACARHFLYLGRLGGKLSRDFETLLSAFNEVAATHPECQLAFVGGGSREAELRQMLEAVAHARPRTQFVGFADPVPWMEWADVVVQPSLAEGMSNTVLEAMAAGICCIANDIPANREVLGDGQAGMLVTAGRVDELALAMRRVATIPGECAGLGMRAGNVQ
ncbi:MAG: glycosyltransferase family 4 protein [Gammaproteobacteria bacterium]